MNRVNRKILLAGLLWLSFVLAGCSQFAGLRQPLYDGQPVVPNEEAIATYQESREVVGAEKDYYFRYPFSEAIYESSLDYTNGEPLLLGEGTYVIGQDIPSGRVSLLGNESVFSSENNAVHVGNMMIRDEVDDVYFENLFHSDYGPLVAQVDLIEGHQIEIIGDDPQITVFYAQEFPENPYLLMDPPQLLVNLDRLSVQQPIVKEGLSVQLSAGIFEVGVHLEPGCYAIQTVQAPHNTELFRFREGEEAAVYELLRTPERLDEEEVEGEELDVDYPTIALEVGDKIYPNLVYTLELVKVE